jgi:cell division protein FtsB
MTDDILKQLQFELAFIEKHGTKALNDLDHAALLVALRAEIERLRAENQRLKEARFDLQAADHIAESVRDVLHTARRLTDIYRLKEEEKSVPEEYEVFEHKEGGAS